MQADDAPKANGPYSHAVIAGDLVVVSGQLPLDPVKRVIVEGGLAAEAAQALDNLAAVLSAAGSDLQHVLRLTVFLTDLSDSHAINAPWQERLADHRPARSIIQVAGLPRGAHVAIDCLAVRR